jgi:predicted HTH transcriptional regulator
MTIETQDTEYKDFSNSPSVDKKGIVSNLFKEISAFANATGGLIVIEKDDKTGAIISQPTEVLEILENDSLTTSINRLSDNLVRNVETHVLRTWSEY